MTDNRNTILAVILSGIVLIAWQYFYNVPQMEKQRAEAQKQAELQKPSGQPTTQPGAARPPEQPLGEVRLLHLALDLLDDLVLALEEPEPSAPLGEVLDVAGRRV